jgi:hypothetical protein
MDVHAARLIGFVHDGSGATVEHFQHEMEGRVIALSGDPRLWQKLRDEH